MPKAEMEGIFSAAYNHVWPILKKHRMKVPQSGEELCAYRGALLKVLPAIKLVIWDLDRTFWHGTLGEGSLSYEEQNHTLVTALSYLGIMNSLCSHNDFGAAVSVLRQHQILDFFIFPQIFYEPKGLLVRRIIEKCQIRPINILYLDDEPRHREEVTYLNEGVVAIEPPLFTVADLSAVDRTDPSLERLRHYKLLERKDQARAECTLPTLAFLRTSEIKARVLTAHAGYIERIGDLINRTNQLNFTKVRLNGSALERVLTDPALENRCIHVTDRFGDYGIAGFYSLNRSEHRLEHFVFSCRVLGMGLEQYLYYRLGNPKVMIEGEVATALESDEPPGWIELTTDAKDSAITSSRSACSAACVPRVLLRGGCDLEAMVHYIRSTHPEWRLDCEFHHLTEAGMVVNWQEHTDVIRAAMALSEGQELPDARFRIPWLDEKAWATQFGSAQHDIYVLSLLQDFACGTYRLKGSTLTIPCEYFGMDMLDPENDHVLFGIGNKRTVSYGITREFLGWFRDQFGFQGAITEQRLGENLQWLRARLPPEAVLILINGAEIEPREHAYPFDRRQCDRHRVMNCVLDRIVGQLPRTCLIDVRKFVRQADDLTDRLFHYKRWIYAELGDELVRIVEAHIAPGSY
jgi:FkbH-like protein